MFHITYIIMYIKYHKNIIGNIPNSLVVNIKFKKNADYVLPLFLWVYCNNTLYSTHTYI